MGTIQSRKWVVGLGLLAALLAGSLYLVSAPGPDFTVHDKAYYADANTVAFVRPGLVIKILSHSVAADGTVKVQFQLTDPKGLPLDRDGVYTPGSVSTSWILARIPKGKKQYEAYTTRTQVSPITGASAVQAGTDSGGTYEKVSDGVYNYTFKTKLPAGYDKTVTHTIGVYSNRNLEEFELGRNAADLIYNFVPDGSPVTVTRDVIKQVTCNKCHQDLSAHGTGGRKSIQVCDLCHQPQTVDPDTGNTVDMPVMIHKIHMGEELPSVQAGTPYIIIGNSQSVHDFSNVVFPADVRRCTFCHEQDTGAAQKDGYLKPSRVACGACHDNVNFATGLNHPTIEISDNQCGFCHFPQGEVEFDTSIIGAHTIPNFSSTLAGVVVELLKVEGAAPGAKPTLTFSLKNKEGQAILASSMDRLRFNLVGPTSDYSFYPPIQEDAKTATAIGVGMYSWTFKNAIPADAKGTFAIGVEARQVVTLLPGTEKAITNVRDIAANKVIYFSVDGSPVEPRRTTVALNIPPAAAGGPERGCNACHASLGAHGGTRNDPEYCVLCHSPNFVGGGEGVNFAMLVHKLHTGEELESEYFSFNELRYPGDRRRCDWCHVDNSQQLPLSTKLLKVQDPKGLLNPVGATTSACTACHGSLYAASHALANTTDLLGESCAVCHGPSALFSVDKMHAQ